MNANEIFEVILSGIRELLGNELTYLSSNDKKTKIISIDDSHVTATRNDDNLQISLSRFRALAEGLKGGMPVHIDTLFNGGGNDRAIIETITVHLPNVGYMKGNSGRNKSKNKVIQWFATWSAQLSAWQMEGLAQSGSNRPWQTRFESQIVWSFQPGLCLGG